jgi:TetR/AcrR family transcriptional repressor of nem operon
MRYPAEHKQATRDRIVRAAARRFRSRGTEGAAISDLMRDLHLTHGGFYRHFRSKEELFVEAFARGLQEVGDRVAAAAERAAPHERAKALIDAYLTLEHCENASGGCPVAALAAEVARRPASAKAAFRRVLVEHVRRMAAYLPGRTDDERISNAKPLLSGMAGTLAVARTFTDAHERQRMLEEARTFYLNAVSR